MYHGSEQALNATITLKKPWKVRPGQYVYLIVPGIARHRAGFMQSHLYVIAWSENSTVTLLIQRGSGFSDALFASAVRNSTIIVDGPYGNSTPLDEYDSVLFMASGIGIAAHLLPIRHLLEAYENRSARIRRLTLVWFLETLGMSLLLLSFNFDIAVLT
jgi:NAD(P)H-flavin reductase